MWGVKTCHPHVNGGHRDKTANHERSPLDALLNFVNFVNYLHIFNKFTQNLPNWGCSWELFFLKIQTAVMNDFDA